MGSEQSSAEGHSLRPRNGHFELGKFTVRQFPVVATTLLLVACGGGGGSGTPPVTPPPAAPPSVAPTVPTFSATGVVNGPTPDAIFIAVDFVTANASVQYYLGTTYSTKGIASVLQQFPMAKDQSVEVMLKPPSTLAPGTYTDQITFRICRDQACTSPLSGTDTTATVTYSVKAAAAADAPSAAVALMSVNATALDTDVQSTPVSVALNLKNFNSIEPTVLVSTTKNGIAAAAYTPGEGGYTGGTIDIYPQKGVSLNKGTYNDTITVTVCLDSDCANRVGNPLVITAQYTVTDTLTEPGANGYTFKILALTTNDIAWDQTHALLYLSTPPDSTYANGTIRTLDPNSLTLSAPALVVQQPTALAVSDDGQYLYAGSTASGASSTDTVVRLQIPALTTDLTIPLSAGDLAVAPGHPQTVAIATRFEDPLAIYDDAIPRAHTGPNTTHMEWSADASLIYAIGPSLIPNNLYTLSIDGTGVSSTTNVMGSEEQGRVHFDNGLVYIDGGLIVDPATGNLVHQLQTVYQLLPDSAHGKIFAVTFDLLLNPTITSFDINTFQPIATIALPTYVYNVARLIKWGNIGLAVTTGTGYVMTIDGAFVGP